MNRYRLIGPGVAVLALAVAGLIASGLTSGAEPAPSNTVQIGVVNSLFRDMPESMIKVVMTPLKSLMETQTGLSPQLLPGGDAEQLGKQLMDRKVQLGVFHGVEFAWARQKYPDLKPLMITVSQQRQFRAYLVVCCDNGATCFADLKNKTVALPRRSREHCHLFLERRCQACGQPAKTFLAKVTTPPDSEEALDNVVDGVAHAAVVDKLALDSYQERKPGRFTKLKIAQESEVFPAGVIAYRPGALDEATLERFRTGMLSANQTPRGKQLLTMCQIAGFERVPADYDQLLADILKAYPAPDSGSK
jgi:ABC-type phosphate/phosphonate transport system substrate-binding protein